MFYFFWLSCYTRKTFRYRIDSHWCHCIQRHVRLGGERKKTLVVEELSSSLFYRHYNYVDNYSAVWSARVLLLLEMGGWLSSYLGINLESQGVTRSLQKYISIYLHKQIFCFLTTITVIWIMLIEWKHTN